MFVRWIILFNILLLYAIPLFAVPNLEHTFIPTDFISSISEKSGIIERISFHKGNKVVFLIRDIHTHYEAQLNCAKILKSLEKSYGAMPWYVEGFSGQMDLSPYSVFRTPIDKKIVADKYLKNGKISGEEYLAIVNPSKKSIYGLEDRKLYEVHLSVLKDIISTRKPILTVLSNLRKEVLSKEAYGGITHKFNRFLVHKDMPDKFIKLLEKNSVVLNIDEQKYPDLALYVQLLKQKEHINPQGLKKEQRAIIHIIENHLPPVLLNAFKNIELQYNIQHIPQNTFEKTIISLLESMGHSSKDFPLFWQYYEFKRMFKRINFDNLIEQTFLYTLSELREDFDPDRIKRFKTIWNIHIAENIIRCELSPIDAKKLCTDPVFIDHFSDMFKSYNSMRTEQSKLINLLNRCRKYYNLAFERDTAMAQSFLKHNTALTSVLIAGGFHTIGLEQLLSNNKYTVVVITPRVSTELKNQQYFSILNNDLNAVEKLFAQQSLLRQPALIWRKEHNLGMQFELLRQYLTDLTDRKSILQHLRRLRVDSELNKAKSLELLDKSTLFEDQTSIYVDFAPYKIAVKITPRLGQHPELSVIQNDTRGQRVPVSAQSIDLMPAYLAVAKFMASVTHVEDPRKFAQDIYESIYIYDSEDYLSVLMNIKRQLTHGQWNDHIIRIMVLRAIIDYVGLPRLDELTQESVNNRLVQAEKQLEYVFQDTKRRVDFVRFLAGYTKISFDYNNYLTPLFLSALNVAEHRPISDQKVIEDNPTLFRGNYTIQNHPWFGSDKIARTSVISPDLVQLEPIKGVRDADGKKQLRVLIVGVREHTGKNSPAKILQRYLATLPKEQWNEITIESRGTTFSRDIHPFDSTGQPKESVTIFPFDSDGKYYDEQTGILYRRIKADDAVFSPLSKEFMPKDTYDIVITSDVGFEKFTKQSDYTDYRKNLQRLLDDRGVLFLGMGILDFASVFQRSGSNYKRLNTLIPFSNLSTDLRNLASLRNKTHYINPADRALIEKAYKLRLKYQLPAFPAFDILTYTQFLAEFGENAVSLAAFILDEIPSSEIRINLPHHADIILGIQQTYKQNHIGNRFSKMVPTLMNISSSNPENWIVSDSDRSAKERFVQMSSKPLETLYDNGRYKFEFSAQEANSVVFVTKTVGEWESIKAFIISNVGKGADAVYQSQIEAVSSVVETADKVDFGQVPSFLPILIQLEPFAKDKYRDHWDNKWVRPSPKYLRIASTFIRQISTIGKESLLLYGGKIYSSEIADKFTTHPLVQSNIMEGAHIFQAIYYLNPQLAGVILRSLSLTAIAPFRYMLTQLLSDQFAKMLDYELTGGTATGLTGIAENALIRLLEPPTEYNDSYVTEMSEIIQHLALDTLVTLFENLHTLILEDYSQGWAPALLGRIFFRSALTDQQRTAVYNKLSKPAKTWLELQKNVLDVPVRSASEVEALVDKFMRFDSLLGLLREEGELHFDRPSQQLSMVTNIYKDIFSIDQDVLSEQDRKILEEAVVGYRLFEGKEYNRGLWLLFMNTFNGFADADQASFALSLIFKRNEQFAGAILRGIQKGKHFQMMPILFRLQPSIQITLVNNELLAVSESTIDRFNAIDQFGIFHLLFFRHMFNKMEDIPQDNLRAVLTGISDTTVYNLLLQTYYFYQTNPDLVAFTKDFMHFILDEIGEQKIRWLLSVPTTQERKIIDWLNADILETVGIDEEELAQQLETHPDYERIRRLTVSFDNITSVLQDIHDYLQQGQRELGISAVYFEPILHNIVQTEKFLSKGYINRGLQAWGLAADRLDSLIESKWLVASNIPIRLAQYAGAKIDHMMIDYIARNGLGRIKSILPYNRDKVVAKLRIIPNTQDGIALLFDQNLLNDGFAVVKEYPQNIPDFAKPRAIIAEKGMGRDEHAAERAADWKIPYLVIPRARKFLSGLVLNGETELWVTIELGGRTSQNVLRRATVAEVEEENRYQLNARKVESLTRKGINIPAPDLSEPVIAGLQDIGLTDNKRFGNKTARLGYMRKNGLNVKDGFGLSFGFFEQFSLANGIREKISDILNEDDFTIKQDEYLEQIRNMIMQATFTSEQISMLSMWYRKYLKGVPVIARSSTNAEDLAGYAGAGVYDSFADLRSFEELVKGIKKVYASVWTERAYTNRTEYGIKHLSVYPAVLVQEMINARYSGVINTGNEMNKDKNESTMSISVGYGGAVDGLAAEFVFDRTTQQLIEDETDIPDFLIETDVADLQQDDFSAIDEIGQRVKQLFGGVEQKIEFAEDDDGLWINQSKNLPAFNESDTDSDKKTSNGMIEFTDINVTIGNRYGLYLKTARQLANLASRFQSAVYLVKITEVTDDGSVNALQQRPMADAKNVLELQQLNAQQGESVKVVAFGSDAKQAVKQINNLIENGFNKDEEALITDFTSTDNDVVGVPRFLTIIPEKEHFVIVQVRGRLGMHASPSAKLSKLIRDIKAQITMYPISETTDTDITQEIIGAPFDPIDIFNLMMQGAEKGTRFKVIAKGYGTDHALEQIKEFFDNNMEEEISSADISIEQSINEGAQLTLSEKQAIHSAVNMLKIKLADVLPDTVQTIVFDSYIGSVGYFTDDKFVSIDLDINELKNIQLVLVREAYSVPYITNLIQTELPGIAVQIFNKPMNDTISDSHVPISNTIRSVNVPERYL